MKNLKVGDRVNVSKVITEDWQSQYHLNNAEIVSIKQYKTFKSYYIRATEESTNSIGCPFSTGGHFTETAYNIELH